MEAVPPVIELDRLIVRLGGRTILDGLTGAFSGRSIGLLGPNGAGKSTLINTLLGFFPAASGHGRVFGSTSVQAKALRRAVGYMPENDAFIAGHERRALRALLARAVGPARRRPALERAHEALFDVGLGEVRYRTLDTYSLGMKQLAKLAQAIAHGPRLLFLDEPTNGLDPPARQRMLRLIREIRDARRMHVILSSHLLRDVEECCDEVLILKDGRVAALCDLEEERRANRRLRRARDAWARRALSRGRSRSLGCGVRALPERPRAGADQGRAAGGGRDARALPPRRRARRPDPPPELPARLARGHLPRRHEGGRRPRGGP